MIRRYLIPIAGFQQRQRLPNGMERLWRKLRDLELPQTVVFDPIPWHYDFEGFAAFLARQAAEDGTIDVRVFAYSWGAGHGLPELGQALDARGIPINAVVACDPIYRSWLLSFRWRAMWFGRSVMLPPNVLAAWWFYQRKSRPRSAGLVPAPGSRTVMGTGQELDTSHIHADDSWRFHELSCEIAAMPLADLQSMVPAC